MSARIPRAEIAARIARDIPDGSYVNLGIGAPTLVADFLPPGNEIILHTENGLLGMGPAPQQGAIDPDLINAGKQPVTELAGAAYFHHADSFAMMRGGHLCPTASRPSSSRRQNVVRSGVAKVAWSTSRSFRWRA